MFHNLAIAVINANTIAKVEFCSDTETLRFVVIEDGKQVESVNAHSVNYGIYDYYMFNSCKELGIVALNAWLTEKGYTFEPATEAQYLYQP